MRLLIVKTTSMGDVVHALPAVTDLLRLRPGIEIDWLVEAPFAAIPALHPGVRRVLPLAWRRWRRRLGERATWQAMGALRSELRRDRYDLVLDLQGLLKSALWACQARGERAGYDAASAREPLASWFYRHRHRVDRGLHAVERSRRLAAAALGAPAPVGTPDFGIAAPASPGWAASRPYAVLIPAASRVEKLWPQADWIAVGRELQQRRGWTPVLLWGSAAEHQRAQEIADGCGGVVPPFLSVRDAAAVLAGAEAVVGLDTGFSHLAAAFGRPTLGIYCDHEPALAGITGPGPVASLGGRGQVPALAEVLRSLDGLLPPR